MRKLLFLVATISIIAVAVVAGFMWFSQGQKSIEAQLVIEFGDVQVKHVGEIWEPAENGMLLVQSDSIKTGVNS